MTTLRNIIEIDGDHNTVADAIALSEERGEIGGLYVSGFYVDAVPVRDRVLFVVRHTGGREETVGDFSRAVLADVADGKLVPFVHRCIELSGLLEA